VIWTFRVASLGLQAVMWTTIAVGFGFAAGQVLEHHRDDHVVATGAR
jgi:hypothetical protein